MTSLLNRLFGRAKKGSGATAKNRLHFVLQHDRINLPPQRMEAMKREILAVIVKYLVVDQERVEIALEQRDRAHSKLVAEIPFAKEKQVQMELQPQSANGDANRADSNGATQASDESNSETVSADDAAKKDAGSDAAPDSIAAVKEETDDQKDDEKQ